MQVLSGIEEAIKVGIEEMVVDGSTRQRLNPNQSMPALIPLDRPQTE